MYMRILLRIKGLKEKCILSIDFQNYHIIYLCMVYLTKRDRVFMYVICGVKFFNASVINVFQ